MPIAEWYDEAIGALPGEAELEEVSGDPFAYWRLIRGLWATGEPFIVVEHDIVIRDDTLAELEACPHRWCAFLYHEAPGEPVSGLGCAKLTPDGSRFPDIEVQWGNVDYEVAEQLRARGMTVHEHGPWLRHLNPRVADYQ